ncbi:TIGR01212 family radical SAM protein [Tyzzerella sp. OttesenSCG-928-J15]|nr:TIGR01212 family radical SAM protein [Tyzzerella sp. OttesenSCG-928-J15]
MMFGEKRFHSVNYYLQNTFGAKVIKISLDAGLTCPNRDGTLSREGCIFCGGSGSGDYAFGGRSIKNQFELYRNSLRKKWPNAKYIAYFQAYTNTYGDIELLRKLYYEAIDIEGVVGISIATRPDCLGPEVLALLKEIGQKTKLYVELGFQSSKPETVQLINRCYENHVFNKAVKDLKNIGANVICHVILGLPYETEQDMLGTVNYAIDAGIDGIKFHQLFVVKNTKLEDMYNAKLFDTLELEEYVSLIVSCLEILPEDIVVHRLTGDAPREQLIAPLYSIKKFNILNGIDNRLKEIDSWQSKNCGANR